MPKLGQHQPMATENQEELVNLLKAHPEGLTVNEIAKMVGTSPKIVYQRINYVSLTAPIFDEGHYYFCSTGGAYELIGYPRDTFDAAEYRADHGDTGSGVRSLEHPCRRREPKSRRGPKLGRREV